MFYLIFEKSWLTIMDDMDLMDDMIHVKIIHNGCIINYYSIKKKLQNFAWGTLHLRKSWQLNCFSGSFGWVE
jgi:hypothetical protein